MPFSPSEGRYANRCIFCDVSFSSKEKLESHEKDVHSLQEIGEGD